MNLEIKGFKKKLNIKETLKYMLEYTNKSKKWMNSNQKIKKSKELKKPKTLKL